RGPRAGGNMAGEGAVLLARRRAGPLARPRRHRSRPAARGRADRRPARPRRRVRGRRLRQGGDVRGGPLDRAAALRRAEPGRSSARGAGGLAARRRLPGPHRGAALAGRIPGTDRRRPAFVELRPPPDPERPAALTAYGRRPRRTVGHADPRHAAGTRRAGRGPLLLRTHDRPRPRPWRLQPVRPPERITSATGP